MKLTRRKFLRNSLIASGVVLVGGGVGGKFYLDDEEMKPAPEKEGKVLCDLHAHPANYWSLEEIVEVLSSPGLVGLGQVNTTKRNLIYEEAVKLLEGHSGFNEIMPGQLARLGEGYFARTQEVGAGIHDILAVGWEGDYFPDYDEGRKAAEEIKKRKGIAVLNHPYVVSGGLMFRLIDDKEEAKVRELCEMVDEIEIHNAQCINLFPGIAWMKKANALATQLVEEYTHLKGMAGSDAGRRAEQVKIVGNYVDKKIIEEGGIEGLKGAIISSGFEKYGDAEKGPYVSRWSFLMGRVYEQKFGGK